MAISIPFENKYVHFGDTAGIHTQGEARAETYDLSGPRYYDSHDLAALTWYVRASNPDYMTIINKQLSAAVDPSSDTRVIITWPVDADFTAYSGKLDVQFVAKSSTGEEIIKLQSNGLNFAPSVEGTVAPPKNVFDDTLEQMQGILDDAENAAAQSLTDANRADTAKTQAAESAQTAQQAATNTAQSVAENQVLVAQIEGDAAAAAASAAAAAASAEQAGQLAQGCKGWFVNVEALRAAYPTGANGEWAILGSTDSIWVWDTDSSNWINSHQTTDLSDYYTKAQADGRYLQQSGDAAAVTVPFTAPAELPTLPASPATLEDLMTLLASMRTRLVALEEGMPGIGEWWYSPNILTYTGGINSKAFARVNFNDDLSKTVYAALYAKIGDTLSSGAATGYFNCKKLAERFPLAYGANFQLLGMGGSTTHTQIAAEVGAHTHEWVGWAGGFLADGQYTGLGGFKGTGWATISGSRPTYEGDTGIKFTAAATPMNIMNPYISQNIIVRAL